MFAYARVRAVFLESCSLGWERKLGGTFHLKLNTHSSPIANKYREGKVQSTLERELNVPETVVMQAYCSCARPRDCSTMVRRSGAIYGDLGVLALCGVPSLGVCQHGSDSGQKSRDLSSSELNCGDGP